MQLVLVCMGWALPDNNRESRVMVGCKSYADSACVHELAWCMATTERVQ